MAPSLRDRVEPKWLIAIVLFVGVATYVEFVLGSPTVYDAAFWLLIIPLLLSFSVSGVENHPLYRPFVAFTIAGIGVLQYLGGEWELIAAVFIICGVLDLLDELRKRAGIAA